MKGQLERARDALLDHWGSVDNLVNAAGGNVPGATRTDDVRAFELPGSALRLDFLGTILPWPVFGAEGVACIDVALNVAAD